VKLQIDKAHCVILAAAVAIVAALFAPVAGAQFAPGDNLAHTTARLVYYVAHDGRKRPAWLLLPAGYHGQSIPLVISPHGRGVDETHNALVWGDLPGEGGFAVINPAGEGRRLHWYSWGAPGQIDDLARMPEIARANGVNVDPHRIYAFGGSMGGQETLLLDARYPHLLAGAAAFDPATDMARRYRDFGALKNGRQLQQLCREEIGGPPKQVPWAYAERSPDAYVGRLAESDVPLQLYWSFDDRIISDQRLETGRLADEILADRPQARVWEFIGDWQHTAEMHAGRRLPRALARFGLLPESLVPPLAAGPTTSRRLRA
jgi:pimeloyl-ACP methyl ester carboxylesterase